jgi:hypothetical protein
VESTKARVFLFLFLSDQTNGEAALRHHAIRLGDVKEGGALLLGKAELEAAWNSLTDKERGTLLRTKCVSPDADLTQFYTFDCRLVVLRGIHSPTRSGERSSAQSV